MLQVNTVAPFFTAPAVVNGQIEQGFSLEKTLKSKAVMLVFYPKDFTFICPTELLTLQENLHSFYERGVQVIACSTDTIETHLAWLNTPIQQGGIKGVTFPLVADEGKTIASNYQVLGGNWYEDEKGQLHFQGDPIAYRATFLIDQKGVIQYHSAQSLNLGRNINELLRIVDMWNATKNSSLVCPANWKQDEQMLDPTPTGIQSYLTQRYDNNNENPYLYTAVSTSCCQQKTSQDSSCKSSASDTAGCCESRTITFS